MKQCRNKPLTFDVVQWDGTNQTEVMEFMPENATFTDNSLTVECNEEKIPVEIGDFVIKIQDKFFPCNKTVFNDNYDIL